MMSGSIQGKTVVITGANIGIGKETAKALAKQGANVVLVCRNPQKAQATIAELKSATGSNSFSLFQADLASMRDVRRLAGELLAALPQINVLINNAGIYLAKREVTDEGLETTFAVNHMAPFLLTRLLWNRLTESAPARVINLTSIGHRFGKLQWDNLQGERHYTALNAYGIAKLANILFTQEMVRQNPGSPVTVNCVHPGAVASNFAQDGGGLLGPLMKVGQLFLHSPASGAAPVIRLASDSSLAETTGQYFNRLRKSKPSGAGRSEVNARRMWDESCRLFGVPAAL